MGRPVVLSNGQLFVGLDENGLVHDFYYPYVGLDDLTNARSLPHKIGVWWNGTFSWTDSADWATKTNFEEDALISRVIMTHKVLQLRLEMQDFVDVETNAFIRRITVHNDSAKAGDFRLFMHQVFQISQAGRADTAMYVPDDHYILDYKGRCCLVMAGKFTDGGDFDQYAVGNYGIEGKAGTYIDAEDGELTNNPVEHGGVDSVIRFQRRIEADGSCTIDYWIAAGQSQYDAQLIHAQLKRGSLDERLQKVRDYWHAWLATDKLQKLQTAEMPAAERVALNKSLLVIKAHCDSRGSILASGDSSIFNYGRDYYCYCWPRDAAYALWPLIRTGHYEEARKFFAFARDTRHRDGYMMHKYQPDRAIGSTWHPLVHGKSQELAIQEDETAIVVYMMGEYFRETQDTAFITDYYQTFIKPCSDFMCQFVDDQTGLPHASYDLWEQKFLTSTYTVSVVVAALQAAATLAEAAGQASDAARWQDAATRIRSKLSSLFGKDGYFTKGFLLQDGQLAYDPTLDVSSFYGMFMFARLPLRDEQLMATVQAVETRILASTPAGGVLRFEGDDYFLSKKSYKGNPWVVCTLWLAQYYISCGALDQARGLIDWALARQLPSGVLSEQFDPESGSALSVTPLVWSHAELVNTLLDYYKFD